MKCCSLYAGLLRTPIEIQEYQSVPDAMGGQVEQWVTVMRVRTHWKHASMYEQLQAMKLNAGVIPEFICAIAPYQRQSIAFGTKARRIRYVAWWTSRNADSGLSYE